MVTTQAAVRIAWVLIGHAGTLTPGLQYLSTNLT
jgi:hypothetical protein